MDNIFQKDINLDEAFIKLYFVIHRRFEMSGNVQHDNEQEATYSLNFYKTTVFYIITKRLCIITS